MNEETEWDYIADADTVAGPIERVMGEEIMEAFMHLTIGKAPWTTEAYAEMILASEDVGIFVLMELRQIILDGKGMPEDSATTVAIPIFYGKGDIINCGVYIGVQLLEHAMKIVEKLLEK